MFASSISTRASRAANAGSSASARPFLRCCAAKRFSLSSAAIEPPMPAMLVRSQVSRYLAQVQPRFSSPTRLATGTRTWVKNTSLTSRSPSSVTIGRSSTPGDAMSTSRKLMPACFFAVGSVRTRQKIMLACWPSVVQVFWPSTT